MSGAEVFSVAVSAVAMATSLVSVGTAGYVAFRDRTHLRVSCGMGYVDIFSVPRAMIMITVINDGRFPDFVSAIGTITPERQRAYARYENFPLGLPSSALMPGDSLTVHVSPDELRSAMSHLGWRSIEFFADTRRGKQYRCKPDPTVLRYLETGEVATITVSRSERDKADG